MVVYSSAVARDNPELQAARQRGIPVIPRAEMLAELMRVKHGIAIAGHAREDHDDLAWSAPSWPRRGSTRRSSWAGASTALGSNARLGQGEFLVAEADESDGSFLRLTPTIAVVTTIDAEHLDYYRDLAAIREAFLSFVSKVPFYGAAVLCADQPEIQAILPRVEKRVDHLRADGAGRPRGGLGPAQRADRALRGAPQGRLARRAPPAGAGASTTWPTPSRRRRSAWTSRCRSRSCSGRSPPSRASSDASR